MLDLISIGDVTEDVFVQVDDSAMVKCDAHHACTISFPFGTKLGIKKVDKLIGGNAGNMAIGSSRLGLRAALYAEVGDDTQGKRLLQSLKDNNVSTKYFFLKNGEKTNYSVVLYYHAERTILVHHEHRKYKFPKLTKAKYVYLTSMAQGSEKIFKPLLTYVKKTGAKLAFNPGTYQFKLGLYKLKSVIKHTEALTMNTEEAQQLLKTKKRDFQYLTEGFHKLGARYAIITDGPNGTYCFDGKQHWYCPIFDTPLVERTGAGDAFSTGFLSALVHGRDISTAMTWGTLNSASVIQYVGPQEGLIKIHFLKKVLKANPKFKARLYTGKEVVKGKTYTPKRYRKW
jgi:sugar/nucleoside kinase (ribokinase family)